MLVAYATDSNLGGVAAGGVAGGLVGLGIANASALREWAMITDFVLEEYSEQPVEFEVQSDRGTSGTSSAGVGNSRIGEGGSNTSSNSTSGAMLRETNYFPHGLSLIHI